VTRYHLRVSPRAIPPSRHSARDTTFLSFRAERGPAISLSMVFGIISLVLYNQPNVQAYFAYRNGQPLPPPPPYQPPLS
ncbi:MAG: hypothetical protein ACP5UR_17895, partial [Chloroflexus sp.]